MGLKRSIKGIVSILLLAGGVKLVMACADGPDPADLYISFFQNNINAQPEYKPVYYTDYYRLGPIYSYLYEADQEDDAMPSGNTAEWYAYCNKEAKSNDIDSFMVKVSYSQLRAITQKKTVPNDVKNNTFVKYLLNPKNKEALDYMLYAKRCEPLCVPAESVWDEKNQAYADPVIDTSVRQALITEGVQMNGKTKTDFLKWRYGYQAMRLAFYNGQNDVTLKLYDKLIGAKTADNNGIYARCLGLKAGALYHTRKKKAAAYTYSRVFDLSNDMKRSAMLSFIWVTDSIKIPDLFSLCKSSHEKAMLLVMDGLHERTGQEMEGMKLLEKAYALDPGVKGLDVIMTREINKAEQRYMSEKEAIEVRFVSPFEDFYDAAYAEKQKAAWKKTKVKYKTYLKSLNTFAQKMAASKGVKDKAYWLLASSYLYFIDEQYTDSRKQLDLAGGEKMNPHEKDVYDIVGMLCTVHKNGKITAETEAELLPFLKAIEAKKEKSQRFMKTYRDMMYTILTDKYMQQQDTAKALYCLARTDKDEEGDYVVADDYTDLPGKLLEDMTTDRLKQVEAFVQKSSKTDFEEWLTDNTPYTITALKEMEGTKYIREMKYDKAVAVLNTVPRSELPALLPDFSINDILDRQEWDEDDSATMYNKLDFAKKMAAMQKTIEAQPKNGRVAFQYANALYSISYYGRAHHAVDYFRSTSDQYGYFTSESRKKLPDWKRFYYTAIKAQKYYIIAMNNTSDVEMKARCLFMAAKCLQKNCDLPEGKNRYEINTDKAYYLNTFNNTYLEQFQKQYSRTKFYREVYTSCSYFRDYVKRMH